MAPSILLCSMEENHRHRTRKKRRSRPRGTIDRLLGSPLFIVLGAIFLLIGIYSSLSATKGSHGMYDMLMRGFAPTAGDDVPGGPEVEGSDLPVLLLYFVPAIAALTASLIFVKNHRPITLPLSGLTAIYLLLIQVKISFINVNSEGCFYLNFPVASLFLWVPTLLLLATSLRHRSSALLILTSAFFYLSELLLAGAYNSYFEYLYPFVVPFSILISWIGQRVDKPLIHSINMAGAWGFLGLLWLRKFVVNSKPEFLPLFFGVGLAYYLVFYVIFTLASAKKENPPARWMQLLLIIANLLLFLGSTGWVVSRFCAVWSMSLYVAALVVIQAIALHWIKRHRPTIWQLPHYFSLMILGASVLPMLVQQDRIILFSGLLSVFMLAYANKHKEWSAFWVSAIALLVTFGDFLWEVEANCLPALSDENAPLDQSILVYGLLIGGIVLGALSFSTWQIHTSELPLPKKWFRNFNFGRLVRRVLFFSIFLTMGWLGFVLAGLATGTLNHFSVAWFTSGCLYFLALIALYSRRQSSLKMRTLYLSAALVLTYPLLVHWDMINFRASVLETHKLSNPVLLLHYLATTSGLVLGWRVANRLDRNYQKQLPLLRIVESITVLALMFVACTEYDNLSVFMANTGNRTATQNLTGPEQLSLNIYLPYSIVIWLLAFAVFVSSVIRRKRFLRNFAVVLFGLIIVKLFFYDFEYINAGTQGMVYLALGIFLIGLAVIYQKLVRGRASI